MKTEDFKLVKYEADEGKTFDWKDLDAHKIIDSQGNEIQEHLYTEILFLAENDSIDNYIEIDAPVEVSDNE